MHQDHQGRRARGVLPGRAGQGDVEAGAARGHEPVAPGAGGQQLLGVQGRRAQRCPLTASIVCLEVAMVRSGGPTFFTRV